MLSRLLSAWDGVAKSNAKQRLAANVRPIGSSPKRSVLQDHTRLRACRDCHLRPDLVLVYRKCGPEALELVRTVVELATGEDHGTFDS